MLCQATKIHEATVELPAESPAGPFRLCAAAAERLEQRALRPLEWFNLAVIYGPIEHLLHDDFYDERGKALQPEVDVVDARLFPCPTLAGCRKSLPDLFDFALTRWHLDPPIIRAFKPHTAELLPLIETRFASTANAWIRVRTTEIAAEVLGQGAEGWFRRMIGQGEAVERFDLFYAGYGCLAHAEGLKLGQELLAQLPPERLVGSCLVLAYFRDAAVLDWIEANIRDPLTSHWGELAAASRLDWARAEKWLRGGRPLSLVALTAISVCATNQPGALYVMGIEPRLEGGVSASIIEASVREYAMRDRVPRVRKACEFITAHLTEIVERDRKGHK